MSADTTELDRKVDYIYEVLKEYGKTVPKEDIKLIILLELDYLRYKIIGE